MSDDTVALGQSNNGYNGRSCIGHRSTHRISHAKTTHRREVRSLSLKTNYRQDSPVVPYNDQELCSSKRFDILGRVN
jgi:hypothetical protein